MNMLLRKYHQWRRNTLPASRNEMAWRHDVLLHRIGQIGGLHPYHYLGGNWGLTRIANGRPFFVNTKDHAIAPWIILDGAWETPIDNLMQEIVRQGDTCFDIGANVGYYTVRLADKVGAQGRVIAFEPNPELYPFLSENVEINAFVDRVTTFKAAAGSSSGKGQIMFNYSNMGGGWIKAADEGTIDIVAIDELAECPQSVDFVKIDVEGMEPKVFKGMSRLHERSPNSAIITEFIPETWTGDGEPIDILKGFAGERSLFWINDDGSLTRTPSQERISNILLMREDDERFKKIARRLR